MFFLGSKINTGAQSAVNIPSAYLLLEVINASPIGFFLEFFLLKKLYYCVFGQVILI